MILFFMLPAQAQFFKKLRNKVNRVESNINDNPQENKNAENTSAIKSDGSHSDNLSKIDFAKAKIETKTILDKGAQYGFGNYRGNMTPGAIPAVERRLDPTFDSVLFDKCGRYYRRY